MSDSIKNLKKEEAMEQIVSLGVREYGVYDMPLSDKLMMAVKEHEEESTSDMSGKFCLVAGLNNSDTKGVLLALLKTDAEKIFSGMEAAGHAIGAKELVLHIPEYALSDPETSEQGDEAASRLKGSGIGSVKFTEEEYKQLQSAAEAKGITVRTGLINRREYKGSALCHIASMKALADALEGKKEPVVYVAVNGGELGEVPESAKVKDLIFTGNVTADNLKAIEAGYQILTPDALELTIKEAGVTNGILRGLTVSDCIIQETEKRLLESRKVSCGRCVFCREGLIQLEGMHKDIIDGKGKAEYPELTAEIGEAMTFSTPCSMGQKSAEIALSAVKNFAGEYEAHIKKRNCPAGVCSSFMSIYIDPSLCTGCEECTDVCPKDCIEGKAGFIHMIDDFDCIKCGKCIPVCEEDAIIQTTGKVPKLPDRLTKVGKFRKH